MTDPAEIIAAAIQRPPQWPGAADRPGVDGTAVWWAHLATMSGMGGPSLARWIAGTAVEALSQAWWVITPSGDAVPTAAQMRRWLSIHHWTNSGSGGVAGTLWTSPSRGLGVGVPDDDDDPELIKGAIRRVARYLGQADDRITREMLACDAAS